MGLGEKESEIKLRVLVAFSRLGKAGGEVNNSRMEILTTDLMNSGLTLEEIRNGFLVHAQKSSYLPVLSDIVTVASEQRELAVQRALDDRWVYFVKHAMSPRNKLDDWAYDIKRKMGAGTVEATTDKNLPFVKKDFMELARRQISMESEIVGDKRPWKQIAGSWFLIPENSKMQKSIGIGEIMENMKIVGSK